MADAWADTVSALDNLRGPGTKPEDFHDRSLIKRGQHYLTPTGGHAYVTRTSKTGNWVDIRAVQGLRQWGKRMPLGIPITWSCVQ